MFKVRVYKIVWNKEKKEVDEILNNQSDRNGELNQSTYFYDVTLEYPPFIGLELFSENWTSGIIKRVSWSIDQNNFYCYTDDEFPYETWEYDFDENFLKSQCIRHGWKPLTLKETS